jgi:sugar lactone lactonase YvrE
VCGVLWLVKSVERDKRMKDTSPRRFIISVFLILLIPLIFPVNPLAAEEYVFERMWPNLQQPWYFNSIAVAVDGNGNVYVSNWNYYTIKKFTADGQFVTEWSPGDFGGCEPFGLGIDRNGYIYVASSGACDGEGQSILKFTLNGEFVSKWGIKGTGQGQFRNPQGIAVDADGNVYVVDVLNDRVQKFNASNQFVIQWGTSGSGDGQFSRPTDITIDQSGYLYVVDSGNSRIQKFNQDGGFITKWGGSGADDGEFYFTSHDYVWHEGGLFGGGITADKDGNICVLDNGNNRIQKFTSEGQFLAKWTNFYGTEGIAAADNGNIYVGRGTEIVVTGSNGQSVTTWGSRGDGDGELASPSGIVIDGSGSVFVSESANGRIKKFTADGNFTAAWQSTSLEALTISSNGDLYGVNSWEKSVYAFSSSGVSLGSWKYNSSTVEGSFPTGIAVDTSGNIYVADYEDYAIKKFSPEGQLILQWGKQGVNDGELNFETYTGRPEGIGIETDSDGYVYVADLGNHRIQKFTLDGVFVLKWGSEGQGDGKFYQPRGIAVDRNHDVYVSDGGGYIQKFTSQGALLFSYSGHSGGSAGSAAGQFNYPVDLAVGDGKKIYVADRGNNRIQVLSSGDVSPPGISKAIIVAGGGPYERNNLWEATEMCANYAYRTLNHQGFTKDNIYYLSADTDLDLDADGVIDVDANATNANLQYAIKTWAGDADDLFIYMVDHGGNGTFRMGEIELLGAVELGFLAGHITTDPPRYCHHGVRRL